MSLLGCSSLYRSQTLAFWGSGKNRYQIEVPENSLSKVPKSYDLMSSKKGAKRYRTQEINEWVYELADAEEKKAACLKDIMRRIFHNFDERYAVNFVPLKSIVNYKYEFFTWVSQ